MGNFKHHRPHLSQPHIWIVAHKDTERLSLSPRLSPCRGVAEPSNQWWIYLALSAFQALSLITRTQ